MSKDNKDKEKSQSLRESGLFRLGLMNLGKKFGYLTSQSLRESGLFRQDSLEVIIDLAINVSQSLRESGLFRHRDRIREEDNK